MDDLESSLLDLTLDDEEFLESAHDELMEGEDDFLSELRELLDSVLLGEESATEAESELLVDLLEWEEEDNPFDQSEAELRLLWQEATEMILDGYDLMLIGLGRDEPESLQTGYFLVEDGVKARSEMMCLDDSPES